MLTQEQLRRAVKEHFAAENHRDVGEILDTASREIEYHVLGPHYPEDATITHVTASGYEELRQLWENYYRTFSSYQADCDDGEMIVIPERNLVFAQVRITATPAAEFEGLPAGRPFRSYSGAILEFDDHAKLIRETVYGSLGQIIMNLRRMREMAAAVR